MNGLRLATVLLAASWGALVAGCAGGVALSENTPGVVQGNVSPAAAAQAIAPGETTQAELAAKLGKAAVIHFDSGYEVWVYRWPGADRTPRSATELVVLLEPNGVVKKVRVRPGYASLTR